LCRKVHFVFKYKINNTKTEYCFFNTSFTFGASAKAILKKVGFVPDYVIYTWCDFFISPKTVYDFYQLTHAKIIMTLVDPHPITGGCHYPCDCVQYKTGCKHCPVLSTSAPVKKLYEDKVKYWSDLPISLVGSNYDATRANETPFFVGKNYYSVITTPIIPFIKTKKEARSSFGIPDSDFVILCGAVKLQERRKGFHLFLDAMDKFSKSIDSNKRRVTLLLLGKQPFEISKFIDTENVNVVQPGFLDLNGLFTAFYAADVFPSTSIDDSGPVMVNYSIACGRPVISFPIGVSIDIVKHSETGYLAKFMDTDDLAEGLNFFYKMSDEDYQKVSERCIALMEQIKKESKPWYLDVIK
jgi:glycosyltransferase involved in cell wall biosynthesis